MANLPTDLDKIPVNILQEILEACNQSFQKELNTENSYGQGKTNWSIPEIGLIYKSTESKQELEKFVENLTDTTEIRQAYAKIYEKWESKNRDIQTTTELPKYSAPTTTVSPNLKQFEEDLKQRTEAKTEADIQAKTNVEVFTRRQQELAEGKRLIKKQLEKSAAAQKDLEGKRLFVKIEEPEPPTLSKDENKAYTKFRELAQENPIQLEEQLFEVIKDVIPESVKTTSTPKEVGLWAGSVAVETVENLRQPTSPKPDIEAAVLVSGIKSRGVFEKYIPQEPAQEILKGEGGGVTRLVVQEANDLARIRLAVYQTPSGVLDAIVGPNVRRLILGPSPEDLRVTFVSTSNEATHEVNLGKINEEYQTALKNPLFSLAEDEAKAKLLDLGKKQLLLKIGALPPESSLGKLAANEKFQSVLTTLQPYRSFTFVGADGFAGRVGQFVFKFSPESAPLVAGLGDFLGIDFGIAPISSVITQATFTSGGTAATTAGFETIATVGSFGTTFTVGGASGAAVVAVGAEAVTTTAIAGTTGAVTATVGAEAGAAAGATVGSAIPVVGTFVGAVLGFIAGLGLGKLVEKIPWDKVKKFSSFWMGGVVGIMSLPFLGLGAAIGLGVGVTFLAASFGAGMGGLTFTSLGLRTGVFIKSLTITFTEAIGIPILIISLSFPLIVALILFIINSGAYLVPPGTQQTSSTNPYISVVKTANPSGQLPSPTDVTYTITITAKKDVLTGITLKNTCKSIGKNGISINCEGLEKMPAPADIPAQISPGAPFTFTFTSSYDKKYQDSLVSDQVVVNAVSASGGKVSEVGSASICFGECPLDCFAFPDSYWPENPDVQKLKSLLTEAIARLVGEYPNFTQKVCAGGTVNLCYKPSVLQPGIWGYHEHGSTCDIDFGSQVTGYGSEGVLFLLTHEVTHHIQNIDPGSFSKFMDKVNPPQSEPYICTRGSDNPYESMAEASALFVAKPTIDKNAACLTTSFQSQYPKHYGFTKTVMFAP